MEKIPFQTMAGKEITWQNLRLRKRENRPIEMLKLIVANTNVRVWIINENDDVEKIIKLIPDLQDDYNQSAFLQLLDFAKSIALNIVSKSSAPIIMIPATYIDELTDDELEFIKLHEVGHLFYTSIQSQNDNIPGILWESLADAFAFSHSTELTLEQYKKILIYCHDKSQNYVKKYFPRRNKQIELDEINERYEAAKKHFFDGEHSNK